MKHNERLLAASKANVYFSVHTIYTLPCIDHYELYFFLRIQIAGNWHALFCVEVYVYCVKGLSHEKKLCFLLHTLLAEKTQFWLENQAFQSKKLQLPIAYI